MVEKCSCEVENVAPIGVYADTAKIFKAFCDEKRLAILANLASGEKCVCYLMEVMNIGQSSISYHMKILCDAGVVVARQEGKWVHYSLDDVGCKGAVEILKNITKQV